MGFFYEAFFVAPLPHLISGPLERTFVGLCFGAAVILIDIYFKRVSVKSILSVFLGGLLGLSASRLLMGVLAYLPFPEEVFKNAGVVTALWFSYLGAVIIVRGQSEFTTMIPFVKLHTKDSSAPVTILDTSVIIDGRVADMCETGFLFGKIIIPRFVLKELQLIADSADSLKRNRGRRGLDVLNRIKNNAKISVMIHEAEYPGVTGVDAQLVRLAKDLNAHIFTNDYNLNKVAELQGVSILNINELANALKPVVMPGEVLRVKVIKEGKEYEQGIAYLDDGTMIVVDNGRSKIGQHTEVTVTSVLQTPAGRMIFARFGEEGVRPVV
ncbi:MAG: TRAM domain-containing protein [Candidatus Omnitrophica bacterium]|nr:TRAM domain-containing protein [Candidatus Omnitrophota bacterium]